MRYVMILSLLAAVTALPLSAEARPVPENGTQRLFHTNGQVKLETYFKHGTLVRKRAYYDNGRLLTEYRYKDGRPYLVRHYYEDGQLKSIWKSQWGQTRFYRQDGSLRAVVDTPQAE